MFHVVKQEFRDKFSGAMEAFTRRNGSSSGVHGNHSRNDVPSSKDVVGKKESNFF